MDTKPNTDHSKKASNFNATDFGPESVRKARGKSLERIARKRRQPLTADDVVVVDKSMLRRAIAAAALGNGMEWFDFGVYSYLAVYISAVFFPKGDEGLNLLATFGTFAAAFFIRPIGGLVLGPIGDRIGRTKVLALTMLMMAAATFATGLLPGYDQIGWWAPVLLLIARMVQGFSTGGEYGGATTFMAEYSPDKRRGFFGSFLDFGTFIGYSLGAAIVAILSSTVDADTITAWGWRVPFLVAGPIGLIGLYVRLKLEDSPAFEHQGDSAADAPKKVPFMQTLLHNWRGMLVCGGLVILYNVPNYMFTSFFPSYMSTSLGFKQAAVDIMVLCCMVTVVICIIPVGALSDRIGRRATYLIGGISLLLLSYPLIAFMANGGLIGGYISCILFGVMLSFFAAPTAATLPALFPTAVRYTALAVSFNVFVSLFGGTTAGVTESLIKWTGNNYMPAFYLIGAAVIGIIAVFFLRETATSPLKGSPPMAANPAEAREIASTTGSIDLSGVQTEAGRTA